MRKISPKVSILLPIYNYQKVKPTIDSLLNQTFEDFELLICDDASIPPISLPQVIDKRIRFFKNENNLGLGRTLNKLLSLTSKSSKYFSTVEQDDIYKPYFLDDCISFLDNNKEFGLVSGVSEFWDGEKVVYKFPGMIVNGLEYPCGKKMFLLNYKRQIKVVQTCMVVRKEVHQKNELIFSEYFHSLSVDWDYILRFSLVSNIKGLNKIFVRQDRSINRKSLTTKTGLVYKTARQLILNFYSEFSDIITLNDYRYAFSTQLYIELGSKYFFHRIFSLFYDIFLIDPDKKRFFRQLINELGKVKNRVNKIWKKK